MTEEQIRELKELEEAAFLVYKRMNALREQIREPNKVTPLDYVVSDAFRAYKSIQKSFFDYM